MVIVLSGVIEIDMAQMLLATLGPIYKFIEEMFSKIQLKMYFFLIPKRELLISIFYRTSNVNTFLRTFLNDLKLINLKKN